LQAYARTGSLGQDERIMSASAADLFEEFDADWCIVGAPDQVANRIRRYVDAGVTHIQMRVCPGDIPDALAARTIDLVGREVFPQVR
ncbi:MAG: Bac luciferase protein, partial [Chloroflexi bacterium]|nr:Bac luciferase protein [Chloroflexota bacterium]